MSDPRAIKVILGGDMERDKQMEDRCDLALIVYYAIRDWQDRRYACNEEGLVAVKGRLADFIAAAVLANGYRKQVEGENITENHPVDEFICEKCGFITRDCCRYEIDEDDGDEICYEFAYRFCPRCGMKVKGE